MEKQCNICGLIKPLIDFDKHPKPIDGRLSKCKECNKTARRLRYKKKIYPTNRTEKECKECKVIKPLEQYPKNPSCREGRSGKCKACQKNYLQKYNRINAEERKSYGEKYYKEHKEEYSKNSRNWYENNIEKIEEKRIINNDNHKEYMVKYNIKNKDKAKEYKRKNARKAYLRRVEREKENPVLKLQSLLRRRIADVINKKHCGKRTLDILGCSFEEAKVHMENQFTEGMSWENHGIKGWHIDHIIPLCLAKTEEETIKLCHYTNLQPLWWQDNLRKNKKYFKVAEEKIEL